MTKIVVWIATISVAGCVTLAHIEAGAYMQATASGAATVPEAIGQVQPNSTHQRWDDPVVYLAGATATASAYDQGLDMGGNEGYNSDYLFAMTRGIAGSTLNPGFKPLLFLFTVPLDIATLPFAAIGGFF